MSVVAYGGAGTASPRAGGAAAPGSPRPGGTLGASGSLALSASVGSVSSTGGGSARKRSKSALSATRSSLALAGSMYVSEYAASKGTLVVHDHETGAPLVLNTKTAYDRAMERGDIDRRGAETNSSVVHALPKLSVVPVKSAALHMFVEAQKQDLAKAVARAEAAEKARRKAVDEELMAWRRVKMRKDHIIERMEAYAELEKLRTSQEEALLIKARQMGLL